MLCGRDAGRVSWLAGAATTRYIQVLQAVRHAILCLPLPQPAIPALRPPGPTQI